MFAISLTVCADSTGILSMLRRRAGDTKINVRKAALQTLEAIIRLEGSGFNQQVSI